MPYHKYTKELLESVVCKSTSWAQVCRHLEVTSSTGAQTHIKHRAEFFGVDFSHFKGKGWNKGAQPGPQKPIEYYLRKRATNASRLKSRLIKEGLKSEKCEKCQRTEWEGGKLPTELDHINSDHNDNRLENLQILCPNCHAVKTAA